MRGEALLGNLFFQNDERADIMHCRCYEPRDRIGDIQDLKRVGTTDALNISEYRIDPNHAEHARAEQGDCRGKNGSSESAHGGRADLHKTANEIGKADIRETSHARRDHRRVIGRVERDQLRSEDRHQASHSQAHHGVHKGTHPDALFHAIVFLRAHVLADEGHGGTGYSVLRGVNIALQIARGGISRHDHLSKGIDGGLDQYVGDGKEGAGDACGNANEQNARELCAVNAQLAQLQMADAVCFQHMSNDQKARDIV